ncbi:molybdate ABC transporter substrate-binding protein [Blastococcus atacamensis]|uniref:molybdate ABC transporter substrate-binding protein n=1 Tax=Blastococcus atacamensis TaxID=2070508 RepID=UPI000CEC7D04|nr:molybdate ABC transporter substrate-binding protein [Blastococcus atacamensis]
MRKTACGVAAVLPALLAGCGASGAGPGGDGPTGTLTVFAAASLTDAFPELGKRLEEDNPGLTVQFSFAGSSALATQISQGAPADVFASADQAQMAVVASAGRTDGEPQVFARNAPRIAVPEGNPAAVTGLADFAREELALAVCAPDVPCGAAAEAVFAAAGVPPRPDTLEEDVRAALTKVELGEVDAALVYASDVAAAGGAVEGIAFPEAEQVVNDYPVCVLDGARNAAAARAFVDLVLSAEGRRVLTDAGLRAP